MPEPNLPPLRLRDSLVSEKGSPNPNVLDVDVYRREMAPLPNALRSLLTDKHGLSLAKAARLLEDQDKLDFFEAVMEIDPTYPAIATDYIFSEVEFCRKKVLTPHPTCQSSFFCSLSGDCVLF